MPDDAAPVTQTAPMRTPPARGRSGRVFTILLLLIAVGTVASIVLFRNRDELVDPVTARIPLDAELVVQLTLEPDAEQRDALDALNDRIPARGADRDPVARATLDRLGRLVPSRVAAFAREPWVGDQIAYAAWTPPGASEAVPYLVLHAADPAAAERTIQDSREVDASLDRGFVTVTAAASCDGSAAETPCPDDAAPSSTAAFLEAVGDKPLIRDRAFRTARERLGGDGLLLARGTIGAIGERLPVLAHLADRDPEIGVVVGMRAIEDALEVSIVEERTIVRSPLPDPGSTELASALATHAHAVAGTSDGGAFATLAAELLPERLGGLARRFGLEADGRLLEWLGETAVRIVNFGDDEHHLQLDAVATDPDAMRSFFATIRTGIAFLRPDGITLLGDAEDRFRLRFRDFEARIRLDEERLHVTIADVQAQRAQDEAPALGLPEVGEAGLVARVRTSLLLEETDLDPIFSRRGPFGAFGPLIETVDLVARTDNSGPITTATLHLEEAA